MRMTRERLYLFDTTLRDGAQTQGVDFSLEDKALIAQQLDVLGIDYIEAGYPGANPTDTKLVRRAAEARLRRAHRLRHDQAAGPLDLQRSGLPGGARRQGARHLPRRQDLGLSCRRRARHHAARKICEASRSRSRRSWRRDARRCSTASISSTATRRIPITRFACAKAAYEAGARWVVLCDTNGGTLPEEIEAIVTEVVKHIPGDHLGIHVHNDTDKAWPIRSPRCAPARARSRAR